MTQLPLTFGPLAEMATEAAREFAAVAEFFNPDTRAFARLLSDLTRPESQAPWLRWLAERLGVPVPVVGCPGWDIERLRGGQPRFTATVYAIHSPGGLHRFAFGVDPGRCSLGTNTTYLPALDNPDSADAPIRALVVAILTLSPKVT